MSNPMITSDPNVSIDENSTFITQVLASPPDSGEDTTFSISGGADAEKFTINQATGELSFIAAPDFENPTDQGGDAFDNVYLVEVKASDFDSSDAVTFSVTVNDVNDNTPVIDSDGGGDTAQVSINENQTAVTTVHATDADAGDTITYSISGGADAAKFSVDGSTGELTFVSPPDFGNPTDGGGEAGDNVYEVQVQASDGTHADTQDIAVQVNENHAPVITSGGGDDTALYNIVENTTFIDFPSATDADSDALTFSISGGADADKFEIDSNGILVFLTAPDFEHPTDEGGDNVYDLQVRVDDGHGGSDTQDISVNVLDDNDPPVITSDGGGDSAAISIAENTTAVTTVTATDLENDTLTFSITGGNDFSLFTIDPSTGELSFVFQPDFENPGNLLVSSEPNVYSVQVMARDAHGGDTQTISVTVTDANDDPEISSHGYAESTSVAIADGASAVTTVTAFDEDNDPLTFSISGGADQGLFTINASNGQLFFLSAPDMAHPTDADTDGIYEVTVQVSDGRGGFDTQAISVGVAEHVDPVAGDDIWFITSPAKAMTSVDSLLANDTDPQNDNLDVIQVSGAVGGSVSPTHPDGDIVFKAAPGATSGSFDYVVSDEDGHSDTGHVDLQIVQTGSGSDTVTVPDTPGMFSYLDGRGGDDSLTGGAGDDTIVGGNGNDTLDGGGGGNDLSGGAGNDVFNNVGSGTFVSAGDGTDQINASISWHLNRDEENLTLLGADNLDGTGNNSRNVIRGNDGDNVLDGGNNVDQLYGGEGNDTLIGGHGKDHLSGGNGLDVFKFNGPDSGWNAATADLIDDFTHADKIDLSGIDADDNTDGNQDFTFHKNFTHNAGEVQWDVLSKTSILVTADIDGDAIADFAVKLHVAAGFTLQASDIIL